MPTAKKTAPPPDAEAAPAGPGTGPETFEIINDYFEITRPVRAVGALASVPGIGRVARWATKGQHGNILHGYVRFDPDPDRPPEVLATPTDEIPALLSQLEQGIHNPRQRMNRLEKTALESEAERFAAAYPLLAAHYGWIRPKVDRVFDPGQIWYRNEYDPTSPTYAGEVDWPHYRDLHVGGDFGVFGRLDSSPLDDPQTAWMIGLQPAPILNAHAIRGRVGVVRSEYPIEQRPGLAVTVVTALWPDVRHGQQPPFTMMRVVARQTAH